MRFDIVVGNPPYQVSDGGGTGDSAKPIYHHYINIVKKLKMEIKSFSLIIPSR